GVGVAEAWGAGGLRLPELGAETVTALRTFLPPQAGLSNPVDMIASATAEQYARAIEVVGADPQVDALVAIYVPPLVTHPEDIARAIASGAGTVPAAKPVLSVFISSKGAPPMLSEGPRGRLPAYAYPENAAVGLAAAGS